MLVKSAIPAAVLVVAKSPNAELILNIVPNPANPAI
jgi:hypothetical protein